MVIDYEEGRDNGRRGPSAATERRGRTHCPSANMQATGNGAAAATDSPYATDGGTIRSTREGPSAAMQCVQVPRRYDASTQYLSIDIGDVIAGTSKRIFPQQLAVKPDTLTLATPRRSYQDASGEFSCSSCKAGGLHLRRNDGRYQHGGGKSGQLPVWRSRVPLVSSLRVAK